MQDLTRSRILRKLEALPDDQLYQVLDFIEFMEHKYAPGRARQPSTLERFAEHLEDGMRARQVSVAVMSRTMKTLGAASQFVDDLASAGRELLEAATAPASSAPLAPLATAPAIGPGADTTAGVAPAKQLRDTAAETAGGEEPKAF